MTTTFAQTIRTTLRERRTGLPTIATFARHPLFLGVPLFPRQELLLRLACDGRPLPRDLAQDAARLVHAPVPEAGLWLPPDWHLDAAKGLQRGSPLTQLVFIMGRRSSKTTLAALIEAWEIYRLLRLGRAHLPPGILAGQEIAFLNCATSEEQATVHYRALLNYLGRLDIRPIAGRLDAGLQCLLPDNLRLISLHSNARSLRGRTAKVVVFDELAHFQRTAGPASDDEVYRALAPSTRTFGVAGRILITSSPADASGILWELYEARGQVPGLLVAQFASWEFNPHLSRADFAAEFQRHPLWAASEYSAQFPERQAQSFLPLPVVQGAVRHRPRTLAELDPGAVYFLHCDLGLLHDRTVIAIGHLDAAPGASRWAVCDLCAAWQGSREAPVSLSAIESWILDLARRIRIGGITTDTYESALLCERLTRQGLPAAVVPWSAPRKVVLFSRLEDWLRTGVLALPEDPQLIAELAALQRIAGPRGAQFHAPRAGAVTTDDYADALAGLCEALGHAAQRGVRLPAPRWEESGWA